MEAVKVFVHDRDDFEEANEVHDTGNSRGGQWKSTPGLAAVKLRGDSCTVVDGSGASNWPKSTFTVQGLSRGPCKVSQESFQASISRPTPAA